MAFKNLSERPGMGHAQGMVDGVESFWAMLDAAKKNGDKNRISDVVFDAVEALTQFECHTRAGAAAFKFLELVAESIAFYARHAEYEPSLDAALQKAKANRQILVDLYRRKMAEEASKDRRFQSFLAHATKAPRE